MAITKVAILLTEPAINKTKIMKLKYEILFLINLLVFMVHSMASPVFNYDDINPEITASPNPLEFEDTYLGEFVQQLITIENTGTAALEVTEVSTTDPSFLVMVNPFTLEPGETQNFVVRFQPLEVGYIEGFLEIENNGLTNPYQVPLSGTGIEPAPQISASPDPLTFDDTYIASSSQKNLYITNNGSGTLEITEFIFPNIVFETYNNPPITLAPGETHDMVIHFKPFELGANEGSVQFLSNDPANPVYEVQLVGLCIDDAIDGWEWIYTGIDFGFTDISFPEGQNQIGYTSGQTSSYNGFGMVAKTVDGGNTWTQVTTETLMGLTCLSFPTADVGYAAGWDGKLIKTMDGGETWETIIVNNNIWLINDIEFWDTENGIVLTEDIVSYVTNDGGQTWIPTTGLTKNGYEVNYADENTLYIAGNENYVFKSTDGGLNWTEINAGYIGELLLGVNFLNADYGYAVGDYGYILRTEDGGITWDQQNINDELFNHTFVWDSDTAWAVATPERIYKTIDGGNTWQSVFNGGWQLGLSKIIFTDNYTGFVSASNGVILRKEGIELAPEITTSPESIEYEDTYVGQFVQQLLTVENSGTSILEVTDVSTTDPAFILMVNPFTLEPGETQSFIVRFQPVEVGYVEGFVQIENNSSVNPFLVPLSGTGLEPGPAISASPDPLILPDTYIGSDSQSNLFITNNGLATLTITDFIFSDNAFFTYNNPPINIEPGETHDMVIKFAPFELGLIEGSVQFITNDPQNPTYEVQLQGTSINDPINGWEWHYTGFNYILMDMDFPEGQNQIGYCVGQTYTYNGDGVVIKTIDGGDTWEAKTTGVFPGLQGCSFPTLNTGYAVGWDGYIIKTTNGGNDWIELFVGTGIYELIDVEFKDEENGIAIGDNNAYYTNDGGETWIPSTGITNVGYQIDYAANDTYYIAGNEGHIYKTVNGGQTWTDVGLSGGLLLGVEFLNENYGIVTGDNGIIAKTQNGGDSWDFQQVNDNLFHGVFIWDHDTSWIVGTPDLIYKSTDGGATYTSQYPAYSAWKALYKVHFTDNYTGFICGGSNGIVLRKQGLEMLPIITVDPTSIDFPDTYIGESESAIITVSNTGLAPLEISNIESTNDMFSVDETSFTVEPGESQEIEITFTPSASGLQEGMLLITSNDPETDVLEIVVSGNGMMMYPEIVLSHDQIVFDTTLVNENSSEILTISNEGMANLEISNISSTNAVFTTDLTSATIEPGNSQEIVVTFSPVIQNWYEATLQIESNDPSGMEEVDLSGYGDINVGMESMNANDILVFPNPVKDLLLIKNLVQGEVHIYNLNGKLILKQVILSPTAKLDVSNFTPGTYLLKIIGESDVITKKFEVTK